MSFEKIKIHRNLSFEEYFSNYTCKSDGRVRIATYSFNDGVFEGIYRLMPFSIFYISSKYKNGAIKFLRRFPHYLVYVVEGLHTKCVLYERSGKALIGSQNFYSSVSNYEELSCEVNVPGSEINNFISLAYDFESAEFLRVAYEPEDIEVYGEEAPGAQGRPYLPCHNEIGYWGELGVRGCQEASRLRSYIYLILEYLLDDSRVFLAFDRHYRFCGELQFRAFDYLVRRYAPRAQEPVFLPQKGRLISTSPFKDRIAIYHPVLCHGEAICAHYLDD